MTVTVVPVLDHGQLATHLCSDAMTNKDALLDVLKPYNVCVILGGHYHKAKAGHYRGHAFVQLPSPVPGSPSDVTVVRITSDRIVPLPYDYQAGRWSTERGKILDSPIPVRAKVTSNQANWDSSDVWPRWGSWSAFSCGKQVRDTQASGETTQCDE